MKTKTILAFLLALVLALSCSSAVFAADISFDDVPEDAYYAAAVEWAVEKSITAGMAPGEFRPDFTVNRAQAVTFLWCLAGQPEPTQTQTFPDVEADGNSGWYRTAVQWAVEKGITAGTGKGFEPYLSCSRGMILTMLYAMQDCPWKEAMAATLPENEEDYTLEDLGNALIQGIVSGVRSENVLSDVAEGQYYEIPIIWAMFSGILDENQLDTQTRLAQPNAGCPRKEMVYFLYHASGDAPAPVPEGAVQTGTIPETVLLDKEGVKITARSMESEGLSDARMILTVENGSKKTLRLEADEFFVNTFAFSPQLSIPVEDEDGVVFYADAIVEPGETKDALLMMNSIGDKGIKSIGELEIKLKLAEVEKTGDGDYEYADDFAEGETVYIQTSLYDASASYDMEGTPAFEKDGLTVLVTKAENDEYSGPQISVYAYNSGSEAVSLSLAAVKLDGEEYEASFNMDLPAGKRSVEEVFFMIDFENIPVVKEAELTFEIVDPQTWETVETLDPVTIVFGS